jgi:hypothetical protein
VPGAWEGRQKIGKIGKVEGDGSDPPIPTSAVPARDAP